MSGDVRSASPLLRVVVVEDQLMFLQLLVGMLRSLSGLEVVASVTTATAGRRACRELHPDLLLLDLGLPDQDGLTVAEALAAVNPEARVIVLSANASSFVCDAALDPMLHAVVDKVDACETLAVEIAEQLGLSVHTIDSHRRNISLKLGVKGGELVRQAALRNLQGRQPSL